MVPSSDDRMRERGKLIFITVRERKIEFSSAAVDALDHSPYVKVYIDRRGKQAAFAASGKDDDAFPFWHQSEKVKFPRTCITRRSLIRILEDVSGVKAGKGSIRFEGKTVQEEGQKFVVIDLNNHQKKA